MNIGRVIYGYCNGYFGRDSYGPKRVEGEGIDWVVARNIDSSGNAPEFAQFDSENEKDSLLLEWSKEAS